ncbi:hypothetical protein NE865_16497 [Phthorimaea operculella]|nr:hypothetical protein NE865_16497 [Phthorimaea operculella]
MYIYDYGNLTWRSSQRPHRGRRRLTFKTELYMSPKKVGDDIAKATGDWKGLKIKLIGRTGKPRSQWCPAAALIIRALKEPPRDRKKKKNSDQTQRNITLEDVISIAKTMRPRSMARALRTVKEILEPHSPSAAQLRQAPHDLINDINNGSLTIDE